MPVMGSIWAVPEAVCYGSVPEELQTSRLGHREQHIEYTYPASGNYTLRICNRLGISTWHHGPQVGLLVFGPPNVLHTSEPQHPAVARLVELWPINTYVRSIYLSASATSRVPTGEPVVIVPGAKIVLKMAILALLALRLSTVVYFVMPHQAVSAFWRPCQDLIRVDVVVLSNSQPLEQLST